MDALIGQYISRYRILERVGSGGMAVVFKAEDSHLDAPVAIKIIQPGIQQEEKFLKRFEREAKTLARLSHPNIVRTIDYGTWNGSPFLVMPYVGGGTLKARMAGPLAPYDAAQLLVPVAMALHSAHLLGIIHRDVKPSNILLTETGDPLLSDFGVARLADSEEHTQLTTTGVGVGTPDYMSPEQWEGLSGPASDQYALAVVFFEMVTGRKPFAADTPVAVMRKHVLEPVPSARQLMPGLPREVDTITGRALAKTPEKRYADMAAFADALRGIKAPVVKEKRPAESEPSRRGWFGPKAPAGEKTPTPAAQQPAAKLPAEKTPAEKTPPGEKTPGSRAEAKEKKTPVGAEKRTPSPAKQPLPPTAELPTQETLPSEPEPAQAAEGKAARRASRPIMWAAAAASVVAVGLLAAWLGGAFGKPPDRTGADVLGAQATLVTPGASATSQFLSQDSATLTAQAAGQPAGPEEMANPPEGAATPAPLPVSQDPLPFDPASAGEVIGPLNISRVQALAVLPASSAWQAGARQSTAFSADGARLAIINRDGSLEVWNLQTRRQEFRLADVKGLAVTFSPDGQYLVAANSDLLRLVHVATGSFVRDVPVEDNPPEGSVFLRFVQGGSTLAVGVGMQAMLYAWPKLDVVGVANLQSMLESYLKSPEGLRVGAGYELGRSLLIRDVDPDGERWYVDGLRFNTANGRWVIYGSADSGAALSPTGEMLATTGALWNVQTGAQVRTIDLHDEIAFSPDGQVILSAQDGRIRLSETGDEKTQADRFVDLPEHANPLAGVAWSPDGRYFAVREASGALVFYGVPAAGFTPAVSLPAAAQPAAADNQPAAQAAEDNQPAAVQPAGREPLSSANASKVQVLAKAKAPVSQPLNSVAFSPDGKLLAAGSDSKDIYLWNAESGKLVSTLSGHTGWVRGVAFSADGRMLASASADETIRLWDPATGLQAGQIDVGEAADFVEFLADGKTLAAAGIQNGFLIDIASGKITKTIDLKAARSLLFATDTGLDYNTGYRDSAITVDDVSYNAKYWCILGFVYNAVDDTVIHYENTYNYVDRLNRPAAVLSPSGEQVLTGSGMYRIRTGERYAYLNRGGMQPAINPKSSVVAYTEQNSVYLLDYNNYRLNREYKEHTAQVIDINFSADGARFATVDAVGNLFIWGNSEEAAQAAVSTAGRAAVTKANASDVAVLQRLKTGNGEISMAMAFSPDGRLLAAGSDSKVIYLWDTATGEMVNTLKGHTHWVRGVAFSPDGKLLASASNDATVRLWDAASGVQTGKIDMGEEVDFVEFVADGKTLAVGGLQSAFLVDWQAQAITEKIDLGAVVAKFFDDLPDDRRSINKQARQFYVDDVSADGRRWLADAVLYDMDKQAPRDLGIYYMIYSNQSRPEAVFSADEQYALAEIFQVNLATGEIKNMFQSGGQGKLAQFSALSDLVVSAENARLILEGWPEGDFHLALEEHSTMLMATAWSKDGSLIATTDSRGNVLVWGIP